MDTISPVQKADGFSSALRDLIHTMDATVKRLSILNSGSPKKRAALMQGLLYEEARSSDAAARTSAVKEAQAKRRQSVGNFVETVVIGGLVAGFCSLVSAIPTIATVGFLQDYLTSTAAASLGFSNAIDIGVGAVAAACAWTFTAVMMMPIIRDAREEFSEIRRDRKRLRRVRELVKKAEMKLGLVSVPAAKVAQPKQVVSVGDNTSAVPSSAEALPVSTAKPSGLSARTETAQPHCRVRRPKDPGPQDPGPKDPGNGLT